MLAAFMQMIRYYRPRGDAIPAIVDGVVDHHSAVPLKLESIEKREGDALWIRYEVSRPTSDHK
jgi:hypothetical protein